MHSPRCTKCDRKGRKAISPRGQDVLSALGQQLTLSPAPKASASRQELTFYLLAFRMILST